MCRFQCALLAAVAVVGFTSVASAADMPVKAPASAPIMYNWSGIYFGGNVGGAWMKGSEAFTNNVGDVDPLSFRGNSLIGGGQIGLQRQWGNWVLGIEGTFSGSSLSETVPSINPGGPRTRSLKADDIATIVGKVGFASNNWMFYGKAGWADIRVNTGSAAPAGTSDVTQWQSGWTLGTGLDYMLARNWIAGLDFNYYTAGFNRTVNFPDGSKGTVTGSSVNIYAVTGRVSYLFN